MKTFNGPGLPLDESVVVRDDCLFDYGAAITVGKYSFFGHRCMVLTSAHDYTKFGRERLYSNARKPVVIGSGVWVCSGAIICPGVTIGDGAVIGPGAVVMRNVAPYTVVAGNPAKFVRRLRSKADGTKTG
ncbi:MAG: acyltransferase [Candidatus Nanopelagicales bacterium]|jgi:maltose O-acetyltransferase|nr:acyltransferase [Candidatus Nanopelagicales bacterium]